MVEVRAQNDESLDSLLKRFDRMVKQNGILSELRSQEYYEKPSIKRKRKKAARKRNTARAARATSR